MTALQLCERLQRSYPSLGYREMLLDLSSAQREFCLATGIYRAPIYLLLASDYPGWAEWDYTEYDSELITSTSDELPAVYQGALIQIAERTGIITLPEAVRSVETAVQYGATQLVLDPPYAFSIVLRELRLQDYPNAWPSALHAIGLDCRMRPPDLTATGDTPVIPLEYHDALEAKCQALYALRAGNGPVASNWFTVAKNYEKAAKREAREQGSKLALDIRPAQIMRTS